ncbi:MAG: DUF2953 domain-containing protein [Methylocystaceae bacterium]
MLTWILIGILVLIATILLLPLTTIIKFSWDKESRGLDLKFIPGIKMLKYEKNWTLQELETDEASIVEENKIGQNKKLNSKEQHVKFSELNFGKFLWAWYWWNSKTARRSFKRIRLKSLVWETSFSTGDVALTGVATGLVWAVKGWLLGLTGSRLTLEQVRVEVWPQWDDRSLQTRFDCIVNTRLVHIIGMSITAVWYFIRYHLLAK